MKRRPCIAATMIRSSITAADLIHDAIQSALLSRRKRPLVVGICGSQGSGKSTVCNTLATRFREANVSVACLSIDDLYLPRAARQKLAARIHPLLGTRGVPGTHDTRLGIQTLDALGRDGRVLLPRFDKSTDDRRPRTDWEAVDAPVQLVLFEGWCVGAQPQPAEALAQAINELEANEDGNGRWRKYVNDALGGRYQRLFARIDLLVLLAAPSFDVVLKWRTEQEHELRARASAGSPGVMSDEALARFIQHYERLTKHTLVEMPGRADLVVRLAADRSVIG